MIPSKVSIFTNLRVGFEWFWWSARSTNLLRKMVVVLSRGRLEVGVLQDLISQPAVASSLESIDVDIVQYSSLLTVKCVQMSWLTAPNGAPLRLRTWSWSCRSACSLSQTLPHPAFWPESHQCVACDRCRRNVSLWYSGRCQFSAEPLVFLPLPFCPAT